MSDVTIRTEKPGEVILQTSYRQEYSGLAPTLKRQKQHLDKIRTHPSRIGKYAGFKYYGRTIRVPPGVLTTGCQQPPFQAMLTVASNRQARAVIWKLFKRYRGIAPVIRKIMRKGLSRKIFPRYRIIPVSKQTGQTCFQRVRSKYLGKQGFFIGIGDMSPPHIGIHGFAGSWAYKITGATNPGVVAEVHWKQPAKSPLVHEFRTFENFASQWKIVTIWIFVRR